MIRFTRVKSQLVIDVRPKEVLIAVLEDRRLVELRREKQNISFSVGDIYLGTVKKVMPGLNAAFVDIGHQRQAFLHYRDLGSSFLTAQSFLSAQRKYGKSFSPERVKLEKPIPKTGDIADQLKAGDEVMVQITKEAISTKGPRLSAELSFAGRYLVLIPFADKVSVSQKIGSKEERNRLKQLVLSIKPKNVTVIVRTSAEGVKVAELDHELRSLIKKWTSTVDSLNTAVPPSSSRKKGQGNGRKNSSPSSDGKPWQMLHEETNRVISLLRDTYDSSLKEVYVNDQSMVREVTDYIDLIDPGKGDIVRFYDGRNPIFDHFDITRQVKHLFGKIVTYRQGAYLYIEQTEAMHVIDVNSGNRARGSSQQEDTAVDVNLSAAEEIARQMRLRDLGGIIVIDFIDMSEAANRQKLYDHMIQCMANDRAKHTVLPLTKFGLMQITRQRVRQAMIVETQETCPTCLGTGKVQPTLFFTDKLEQMIKQLTQEEGIRTFTLHVHPYVAAYIRNRQGKGFLGLMGTKSLLSTWRTAYGKGIEVLPDQSLGMIDYEVTDSEGNDLSHFLDEDVKGLDPEDAEATED